MLKPKFSTAARRRFVALWFLLDAVVALAPPLYWIAGGRTAPTLGIPTAMFYFLAVCLCIVASLIAAYVLDERDTELAA